LCESALSPDAKVGWGIYWNTGTERERERVRVRESESERQKEKERETAGDSLQQSPRRIMNIL
jgi:hypothetical protein